MKNLIKQYWDIDYALLTAMILLVLVTLTGCGTVKPNPDEGKIIVNAVKTEKVFIEIPETVLNKCQKPARLSGIFADIQLGKVKETELVQALIASYSNEVNCWLSKEEAIKLQRELKEVAKEAKANGK
jgi:hypothetical protein